MELVAIELTMFTIGMVGLGLLYIGIYGYCLISDYLNNIPN